MEGECSDQTVVGSQVDSTNSQPRRRPVLSKLSNRIFAYFSVIAMVMVSFQVCTGYTAGEEEPSSVVADVPEAQPEDAAQTDQGPSAPTQPSVLVDYLQPGGSVDWYGSTDYSTTSEAANAYSPPQMRTDGNSLSFLTHSGVYVVDALHPIPIALSDHKGVKLVKESYFTLEAEGLTTTPANGRVAGATSEQLVVEYDLMSADGGKKMARMQVSIDFAGSKNPKITATVLEISESVVGWHVVWVVIPADRGAQIYTGKTDSATPLSQSPKSKVDAPGLSVKLADSSRNFFVVDWQDALEGALTVGPRKSLGGLNEYALEVSFADGKAVIDPSVVATTSGTNPLGNSNQRKVFNYGGYYWAFYNRSDAICYKKSSDGTSWSSEYVLPEGTIIARDSTGETTGFDVYERDGIVAITWIYKSVGYPYHHLYFVKGTILDAKIVWSPRVEVYTPNVASSPSVAIATDGTFWLAAMSRLSPQQQYYTWYSTTGTTWTVSLTQYTAVGSYPHWFVLMPFANGNMALFATWYSDGSAVDKYAYVSWGNKMGWGTASVFLGMQTLSKRTTFSAVATSEGNVHVFFKEGINQRPSYAVINAGSSYAAKWNISSSGFNGCPTICLDENGDLQAYYITLESGYYKIRHSLKYGYMYTDWTAPDVFYTAAYGVPLNGLASWANPVECSALVWAESYNTVKFGNMPLPYGTPAASAQPWSREGVSPYGTYFSSFKDLVSPGSGTLTLYQQEVSVAGRGTLDLGVSRIYQQPKYFRNVDGQPYAPSAYPYCNIGPGWSLDLPWMDSQYVYVGGGQRFVIQWGNNGEMTQFENHDGAHFLMRGFNHGQLYYELTMSTGMRFLFLATTQKLIKISEPQGYVDANPLYSENDFSLYYDANGRLQTIEDQTYREITFSYNANGNLQYITRPDGRSITFGYSSIGGAYRLTSVTDVLSRVTSYGYTGCGSPACYLLSSVTFPTGGRNTYSYTLDGSVGTEVRSYLVTTQRTEDSATSTLIRQTLYDYKIVAGQITYVVATQKDEADAVKGYTNYIFSSGLKSTSEITKDSSGVQMQKKDTWYDTNGQPARVDTYEGSSSEPTYSEYTSYDDWGNVIFSGDALGHDSYASFANTKTQNSFQGGTALTRTASGKIFYDAFDDWNASDWARMTDGGSILLDAAADPPNSPAMKLVRNSGSGWLHATHGFAAQSGDMIVQVDMCTNAAAAGSAAYLYLYTGAGATERLSVRMYNGNFEYYSGSTFLTFGQTYSTNTWYNVGLVLHYTGSTYDIYIDGVQVKTGANLYNTGSIDTVRLYMNGVSGDALWFDNMKMFKSLSISVTLSSGYVAELYDSKGTLLDRSKTGSLSIAAMPLSFPPGYIKVSKIGDFSYQTPMMDIWGGDSYTMSAGYSQSSLPKTTTGYARYRGYAADDVYPDYSTTYGSVTWVTDSDNAVSGSVYQQSFSSVTRYHGYQNAAVQMYIDSATDVFTQYVWFPKGAVPEEIMVQYKVGSLWKRAYWGGTNGVDDIDGPPAPVVTARIGDVPQVTGSWVQLTVSPAALSISGNYAIYGVCWGYNGSTAPRWDFASTTYAGLKILGLTSGMTVELELDDGTTVSGTATGTELMLNAYSAGVKTFPVSGKFKVTNGATLLYKSPWFGEIYNFDEFTYSAPNFYANDVTWIMHDGQVGSFQYQDYAETVSQEKYIRLDEYGNVIQTKAKLGSGWVFTQASYDQYGHALWTTDETGRATFTEYSIADYRTYPVSTRSDWRLETFDTDTSWTSESYRSWANTSYSTSRFSSPDSSMKSRFSDSGAGGQDYAYAPAWKMYDFTGNAVDELKVSVYLESWYHNGASQNEVMDTGIRMRLYNSAGVNYANYTYWLACWQYTSNNRTAPDGNTIVVYGVDNLPTGVWKDIVLDPSTDWPSINWDACKQLRFEFYVQTSWAASDYLTIYYDNFAYNDFEKNAKTTYAYHTPTGNLLSSTNPLGYTTSQQYDYLGRVTRSNNTDSSYRTMSFDDVNNKLTGYDELNHKTITYYDKIGRTTKVERWGDGASAYSWVTYTYNWQDKTATSVDELGHTTSYTYDFMGRSVKVTNPDSTYSTVTYDDVNRLVTSSSYTSGGTLTHKTVSVKDVLGRLNATREYTTASNYNETLMTYNALGDLLTVRDASSHVTRMTYDGLSRVTKTEYPDSQHEDATYDAAGRTLTKTDREGNTTTSLYDSAGHLDRTISPSETVSKVFDACGQVTTVWNSSAGTNLGVVWYWYNSRGWITNSADHIDGTNYQVSYGWDVEGRQTYVWYMPALQLDYGYDGYDRVSTVKKHSDQSLFMTVTYNKDDSIATETTGDGTKVTSYAYNSRDWVSNIVMRLSGTIKLVLQYSYDDVGNVQQLVVNTTDRARDAKTETYTYDWLDRIRSASGGNLPTGLNYAYDAVGNAVTFAGKTCTYSGYNQLSGDGTWTYTYDGNGNLGRKQKSTEQWVYEFNTLDQLVRIQKGTKSGQTWTWATQADYRYSPTGMMAKSIQGGTTTLYIYRGHEPIWEKTGTTSTYYMYVNGHMFAKMTGTTTYYYIKDALGSVRQVWQAGQTSTTFSVATYKPFGTAVSASGTEKFQYAGEMIVSIAGTSPGLYYIGARWMDPELGRWVSLDPELGDISDPQTLNRYAYCTNNPLRFTDPTGEFKLSLHGLHNWWEKHKTQVMTGLFIAIGVASVFIPGGFLVTVAISATLGGLESGLSTWAHGGSLQDCLVSGFAGAALGGLGGAAGAVGGKVLSKFAGKYLPTAAKQFFKGAANDINKALFGPITAAKERLYSGAYKLVSKINPSTKMIAPEVRNLAPFFKMIDAKAAGKVYAPWKSARYSQDLFRGLVEEGGSRAYTRIVEFQVAQLAPGET